MRANGPRRIIWAFGANLPATRRATTTSAIFGFEAFEKRSHTWIGIGWRLGMVALRVRDAAGSGLNLDVPEARLAARVGVEIIIRIAVPPARSPEGRNFRANLDVSASKQRCRWTPRAPLEAKRRALDQVPGQESERRRRRQCEEEHLPPRRPAAKQPDHPLLNRPAINVDAVRQIAEARRRDDRQTRGKGEPECQ